MKKKKEGIKDLKLRGPVEEIQRLTNRSANKGEQSTQQGGNWKKQ